MTTGTPDRIDATVIIATCNRAPIIEDTLRHFEHLHVPGIRWEILVVDNGSRDGTSAVLERARRSLPLTAITEPRPGKNRALNRALPLARGDLIVFTDDDVIPAPEWLTELVAVAQRWPDHDIFGGRITLALPPEAPPWLWELRHGALNFGRYSPAPVEGPTLMLPRGANYAVRAGAVAGLQFCEDIGPDGGRTFAMGSETELIRRLTARGSKVVYAPSATVQHVVQSHQIAVPFLYGRSFRFGRSLARLTSSAESVPYLFGSPRYVWRELALAAAKYAMAFAGSRRRFEAGLQYHFLRGVITEHRERSRAAQQ